MIFISTGGISSATASETVEQCLPSGIKNFELSGGKFSHSLLQELLTLKEKHSLNFNLHNYFPPPEIPFVLNLASENKEVLKKSLEHCKKAIEWSSKLGCKNYGVHAGFLIDPQVNELGKRVKARTLNDREKAKHTFVSSINELAPFAGNHDVNLLIENNVLSLNNYKEFNENPFLCTSKDETLEIFEQLNDKVSLLLDVAHLKVSSRTLNESAEEYIKGCSHLIKGLHLSDNDGTSDSNEKFKHNSWFWKSIESLDHSYITIEVYDYNLNSIKEQYKLAERTFGCE